MKGHRIGYAPPVMDGYIKIWIDMITMSIAHARRKDLTAPTEEGRMRECHEARCYLLSEKFIQDCERFGAIDLAIFDAAREGWGYKGDKNRCFVCGRQKACGHCVCGRKVCWEHYRIIHAYNGHEVKAKPVERVIKESHAKGRTARWLAMRFGVTVRTANMIIRQG